MEFITRSTKVKCIVASVVTALALITLVMLSTLLTLTSDEKTLLCFIFSISLLFILLIWQGVLEIQVFNDYKSKNKQLCADGIINICMGILIVICATLFGILQATQVINGVDLARSDIRIFLSIFVGVLALWKISLVAVSIRGHRFNAWCEILFFTLWLLLATLILVSMFVSDIHVMAWAVIINSWALIALTVFYTLFSYVIKNPTYLETPDAIKVFTAEQIDELYAGRENRDKHNLSLQDKLEKIRDLKNNNLISEEDYNKLKSSILKEHF